MQAAQQYRLRYCRLCVLQFCVSDHAAPSHAPCAGRGRWLSDVPSDTSRRPTWYISSFGSFAQFHDHWMLGCLDAGNGCLDALSEKKQKRILGSYKPSLVACLTFKFEHETSRVLRLGRRCQTAVHHASPAGQSACRLLCHCRVVCHCARAEVSSCARAVAVPLSLLRLPGIFK